MDLTLSLLEADSIITWLIAGTWEPDSVGGCLGQWCPSEHSLKQVMAELALRAASARIDNVQE